LNRNMLFGRNLLVLSTLCGLCCGVFAFTSPCAEYTVPFPSGKDGKDAVDNYECVPDTEAFEMSMNYLEKNLPSFDKTNKASLGFTRPLPRMEGLDGVASLSTNLSLEMKKKYSWAADVPKDIFRENVLPFASVNEARNNWRPLLMEAAQSVLASVDESELDTLSIEDVVMLINNKLWNTGLFPNDIVFKSEQTPLIYDPMSIIAFGYASCTGVSIFLLDALRSVGVPARLAGTPAWNNVPQNGNHNWIEVWVGPSNGTSIGDIGTGSTVGSSSTQHNWRFIEAAPAGSGESLSNPCDKWFCNPNNFANGTQVFATRYDQESEDKTRTQQQQHYPMAWDVSNTEIPGSDRTAYYQQTCMAC